jgi:8-oxo-dGTP pyrophosphatase MutT (NUDIX family)
MEKKTQSAGGILLRRQHACILIAVVERHRDVEPKWAPILRQLPKGACEGSESLEETARREVEEETGFTSRTVGPAGTAGWSYLRDGNTWHETVTYFFLEPTTTFPRAHDSEFDLVRWITIQEAVTSLSYPEERKLVGDILSSQSLPEKYSF